MKAYVDDIRIIMSALIMVSVKVSNQEETRIQLLP